MQYLYVHEHICWMRVCIKKKDVCVYALSISWDCFFSNTPSKLLQPNHHLFRKKCSLTRGRKIRKHWKLTWNLKITQLKRNIIFETSIFGVQHVNFPGCIWNHPAKHWILACFFFPWGFPSTILALKATNVQDCCVRKVPQRKKLENSKQVGYSDFRRLILCLVNLPP